jgi:hypothetical protein
MTIKIPSSSLDWLQLYKGSQIEWRKNYYKNNVVKGFINKLFIFKIKPNVHSLEQDRRAIEAAFKKHIVDLKADLSKHFYVDKAPEQLEIGKVNLEKDLQDFVATVRVLNLGSRDFRLAVLEAHINSTDSMINCWRLMSGQLERDIADIGRDLLKPYERVKNDRATSEANERITQIERCFFDTLTLT